MGESINGRVFRWTSMSMGESVNERVYKLVSLSMSESINGRGCQRASLSMGEPVDGQICQWRVCQWASIHGQTCQLSRLPMLNEQVKK